MDSVHAMPVASAIAARPLAFGDFVLDPLQQRVQRRDGAELRLTPRLYDALLLFMQHAGELLDKERLMRALWPGLVVEENNLSQVISGLRRALGDELRRSRFIQTVPRRGFRFIAPVTRLALVAVPAPGVPPVAGPVVPALGRRPLRRDLAAGAVAGPTGVAAWPWHGVPCAAGPIATLAVLPFVPWLGDDSDALLGIGIADSVIARLWAVSGLSVRPIGDVRCHAGPDRDPLRAARELQVDWIVEGSVQRVDDRLRIVARLLRAADGRVEWNEPFDSPLGGVFDVQDRVASRIVRLLAPPARAGAGGDVP